MISVCVATYNGEKYIGEQLRSILPQLDASDEVVVADDGSTDHTLDVIAQLADKRIRVVKGAMQHSPTRNFEVALREAKGDYIFLADQDDVWKPHKVRISMEWLKVYDCVVSDAEVTDEHLRVISPSLYKLLHVHSGRIYNTLWKNGYTGCCMAFARRVRDAALPFPCGIPMHDIWIGNVANYFFRLKFIEVSLVSFRRHAAVNSCNGRGSRFSWREKVSFRLNTMGCLFSLWLRKKKIIIKSQKNRS